MTTKTVISPKYSLQSYPSPAPVNPKSCKLTVFTGWPCAEEELHQVLWFRQQSLWVTVFSRRTVNILITAAEFCYRQILLRVTLSKNNDVGERELIEKTNNILVSNNVLMLLAVLKHQLLTISRLTQLYICHSHFGNVSKANRPAYLSTKECSLSVSLVSSLRTSS